MRLEVTAGGAEVAKELEFDTGMFLDLRLDEALGQILYKIECKAPCCFGRPLRFAPNLGIVNSIEEVVTVPGKATKINAATTPAVFATAL